MKASHALLAALALFAALLVAALGGALLGSPPGAGTPGTTGALGAGLGRGDGLALEAALVEAVRAEAEPVHAFVFLTAEERQPTARRGMQARIAATFDALTAAAPEHFSWGLVDPTGDADLALFAARRGVAPLPAVADAGDAARATELFASIVLDRGAAGRVVLRDLAPPDLDHLQALVTRELEELAAPSLPKLLVLAPRGSVPVEASDDPLAHRFGALATALTAIADVTFADPAAPDFDPAAFVTPELVFWLDPGPGAADLAPAVERLLDGGRPVVLAGSPFEAAPGMRALTASLGLGLDAAQLSDSEGEPRVTSIAPDQDFRHLVGQPNGDLDFVAPAALTPDPVVLERRAASARGIAHSRETAGRPKRTLAALVESERPGAAPLVVFAASTPFAELTAQGTAHVPLVQTLLDSFVSTSRRVRLTALPAPPPVVAPMAAGTRMAWRAAAVLPLPLVLLTLLGWRRARRGLAPKARGTLSALQALGLLAGALIAGALLAHLPRGPALDLSDGALNTPPALLTTLAKNSAATGADGPLVATLFASPPSRLPSALAGLPADIEAHLDVLRSAGLEVQFARRFPEDLAAAERDALVRDGVVPFTFQGPVGLAGSERRQGFMTLRLERGGARRDLAFESTEEREELDFRLALALEGLRLNARPTVAFASDLPRMSAAEDYEFQVAQSFAPREGDVFGGARRVLERAGFDVMHVNPRATAAPALPAELDALVWMQPRRDMRPMLESFARHLVDGGRALLAAQHHRTQARQYRGAGFETVFWPQPQLDDLDRFWLPELGVHMDKALRFDARQAELPVVFRQTGGDGADTTRFRPLVTRAPFLVEVPEAQFAAKPALAGVGPLALADPTALGLDDAALAAAGLEASPLFFGSESAWSLAWEGGWLPDEVLRPPATFDAPPLFGTWLRGTFPAPQAAWGEGPWPSAELQGRAPQPGAELALVGSSAVFTDEGLQANPRGGRALLVNLVAELALRDFGPHGAALAALAGRRPVDRSLPAGAADSGGAMRALALGVGALVVLLAWLVARGRGRTTASRAPRAPLPWRPLAGTAVTAGLAFVLLINAAEPSAGALVFGRFVAPEVRAHTIGAVRIEHRDARWTYARQDGVWRELEGLGAIGDPGAIEDLVASLFDAEGFVWARRAGPVADYELTADAAWRVALFDAAAPDGAPFLEVELGMATDGGRGALVRRQAGDAIWHVDRNPRFPLFASLDMSAWRDVAPLADRHLVPRGWPAPLEGLETLAWQTDGAKSLRITRRTVEVTPEELQAGASPFVFDLVGSGERTTVPVPPPTALASAAKPDPLGVAMERFRRFAADAAYAELLDPNDAASWGLGPSERPFAILLFTWPASEAHPEGLSLTIQIGPERAGSHAAINVGTGNLVRLDAALVRDLLPPREAFGDPTWERRWTMPGR